MSNVMSKMDKAILSMIIDSDMVFYTAILMQMIKEEDKTCPSMGVKISNGRIYLVYNTAFVEKLTNAELIAVMEHEILHLVMEHHFRCENRDRMLYNIASDMAINQMIKGLPKDVISYDHWKLPEGKYSEWYYEALYKKAKKITINIGTAGDCDTIDGDNPGKGKKLIGSHKHWKEAEKKDDGLTKEIVRQTIQKAVEQTQKNRGTLPGGLDEFIQEWLKAPTLSWQQLLKTYIGNAVKSGLKKSWKRPSKRFGDLVKGKVADRTVKIGVAFDTSGSVSEADFQEFLGEIKGIQKCYKSEITCMECDAEVQEVFKLKPYGKTQMKFSGRGGTGYTPVFKYITAKHLNFDVLVYFTDFCCTFPEEKLAPCNVIWVVTSNGSIDNKPEYGRVVQIEHPKEDKRR